MVKPIDQMRAVNHYRNYRDTYNTIQGRLLTARNTYKSADKQERHLRLCKAFSWSVISIQTPVHIHEEAYSQLWQNADTTDAALANVSDALTSVNYKNNKEDYIREFFADTESQETIDSLILDGELDKAQKYIIDNVKGLGTVKAPFMLGNNGFVEKMCVDANVISLTGVSKPTTSVVEKYNDICDNICKMFPALNKFLDPYVLQWVCFDYQRQKQGRADKPSTHDVWFESIGIC